jgi:hypothetical protein
MERHRAKVFPLGRTRMFFIDHGHMLGFREGERLFHSQNESAFLHSQATPWNNLGGKPVHAGEQINCRAGKISPPGRHVRKQKGRRLD